MLESTFETQIFYLFISRDEIIVIELSEKQTIWPKIKKVKFNKKKIR